MDARTNVEAHASGFFADLKEWLAIPSISPDPARPYLWEELAPAGLLSGAGPRP